VLGFEWLRLGAMRWFPGPKQETLVRLEAIMACTLGGTLGLGIVLVGIVVCGMSVEALSNEVIIVIVVGAIFWGLGDLQFTLIRFSGRMSHAALLQIMRAMLVFGLTVPVATFNGEALPALLAISAAHIMSFVVSLKGGAGLGWRAIAVPRRDILWGLAAQGLPAAIASQVHLLVTFGLRVMGVAALGAGSPQAAGLMLAIDIVQRPFPILSTVASSLFVPNLNRAYDFGDAAGTRQSLAQIHGMLLVGGGLGCFTFWTTLPSFALLAVEPALQEAFLAYGQPLVGYFCLLLFVQSGVAVHNYLYRRTDQILAYALMHLTLTGVGYLLWLPLEVGWEVMLWMAVGALMLTLHVSAWHSRLWQTFQVDWTILGLLVFAGAANAALIVAEPPTLVLATASLGIFGLSGGLVLHRLLSFNKGINDTRKS
jgi:hypothetical protein